MLNLFRVTTTYGTFLQANPVSGLTSHAAGEAAEPFQRVLLFVPPGAQAGFLFACSDAGTRLNFAGDSATYRFMPLRIQRQTNPMQVALCQSYWGRYLSARPPGPGEIRGALVIDSQMIGIQELFNLSPESLTPPPALAVLLEELDKFARLDLTGPVLLERMEQGLIPASSDVFDSVGRLLPPDDVDWMATEMLHRRGALKAFAAAFPDDIYASVALPDLRVWLNGRPAGKRQRHEHPQRIEEDGLHGCYSSFAHLCSARARRFVLPRKKVAILATMRNEGPYIIEWIAYHQSIGVDDFFLYSNNNSDGSDALLGALADAGVITWIDNHVATGNGPQPQAYGHALGVLPHILDDRWTLVIDPDEFFVFDPVRFSSISDYLTWQEARPVDSIALSWVVYTSGGKTRWTDDPVTSRFTKRSNSADVHNKCMGRTRKMIQSRPHYPMFDALDTKLTRNASGQPFVHHDMGPSFSKEPEDTAAWVNHYLLRSVEEFIWKNSRNRNELFLEITPLAMQPVIMEAFIQNHRGRELVTDTRILDCAQGLETYSKRLRSLPGVAPALEEIGRRVRTEIDRLVQIVKTDPAFQDKATLRGRFAALLDESDTAP